MPRFFLKSLLACVTFAALVIGVLRLMAAVMPPQNARWTGVGPVIFTACWFLLGPLFGAAIGSLCGQIGEGAGWGFMIQVGLTILAIVLFAKY